MAAATRAPRLLDQVRLRNAGALSAGEPSYHAARLREAGMEEGALVDLIDRLAGATDGVWQRELRARGERLGVERPMPWDLARGASVAMLAPGEAAARLGFDLATLPIDFVHGARASTEVAGERVRVTAPAGGGRVILHELGHALLEAHRSEAGVPPPPVHEGVAELVAGLAPLAPGDALADLRLALARAAFERGLYVDEEPPDVVYWRCMERYVCVTCDDASGAWARLDHIESHPARLAAYAVGAAVAAHLRTASEGRMGEMIRALATIGASVPWAAAIGAAAGAPLVVDGVYGADALLAELLPAGGVERPPAH